MSCRKRQSTESALPAVHLAVRRGADTRPPRQKLASIQALRAIAAFGVVACHLFGFERNYIAGPGITPAAFQYGMVGVDLYFVISGFIITLMCKGRFGRQGEAPRFLWRRFIRVYPIFLFWCLAVFAVFLLHPGMVNTSHGRPDVLRSFLLLPQRNLPLLLVSWTLVYEAFFYVLFAGALRWLREEDLPRCLLAWAVVVVAGNLLLQPTQGGAVAAPGVLAAAGGVHVRMRHRAVCGADRPVGGMGQRRAGAGRHGGGHAGAEPA